MSDETCIHCAKAMARALAIEVEVLDLDGEWPSADDPRPRLENELHGVKRYIELCNAYLCDHVDQDARAFSNPRLGTKPNRSARPDRRHRATGASHSPMRWRWRSFGNKTPLTEVVSQMRVGVASRTTKPGSRSWRRPQRSMFGFCGPYSTGASFGTAMTRAVSH